MQQHTNPCISMQQICSASINAASHHIHSGNVSVIMHTQAACKGFWEAEFALGEYMQQYLAEREGGDWQRLHQTWLHIAKLTRQIWEGKQQAAKHIFAFKCVAVPVCTGYL